MEKPHKKLVAWQKSIDLCTEVYRVTDKFPKHELYGLSSQMRRAAVSIASNLAEGAARTSQKEFSQFVSVARGSVSELDTQLEIANRLAYVGVEDKCALDALISEIDRMLYGLWKKGRNMTKETPGDEPS